MLTVNQVADLMECYIGLDMTAATSARKFNITINDLFVILDLAEQEGLNAFIEGESNDASGKDFGLFKERECLNSAELLVRAWNY